MSLSYILETSINMHECSNSNSREAKQAQYRNPWRLSPNDFYVISGSINGLTT